MNLRQYIPEAAWNDLASSGRRRSLAPGAPLMHQGSAPDCAVVLIEGIVKVTETTRAGREVPLALRGKDQILGEAGLLFDQAREATVRTATRCVVRSIPASAFRIVVERHDLAHTLYRFVRMRSLEESAHLQSFRCDSTEVRMARLLARFSREVGETTELGITFHIGMNSSELARMLGISRTTSFEAQKLLQDLKLIERDKKIIKVPSLDRLDRFAAGEITM